MSPEEIWRWDGLIGLREGEWSVRVQGGNWIFLWIDLNRDGIPQEDEAAETRDADLSFSFGRTWSVTSAGRAVPLHMRNRYPCTFMFLRRDDGSVFKFSWTRPGGSEELIRDSWLHYRPN